jgi:hypothetical protein
MYHITGEAIVRPEEKSLTGFKEAVLRQKSGISMTYKLDAVQIETNNAIRRENEIAQKK